MGKLTALGYPPASPQGPDEINNEIQEIYNQRYVQGYKDGIKKTAANAKIVYKYHSHENCSMATCHYKIRRDVVYIGNGSDTGHGSAMVYDYEEHNSGCGHRSGLVNQFVWSWDGPIGGSGGSFGWQDATHTYYSCGKNAGELEGAEITF